MPINLKVGDRVIYKYGNRISQPDEHGTVTSVYNGKVEVDFIKLGPSLINNHEIGVSLFLDPAHFNTVIPVGNTFSNNTFSSTSSISIPPEVGNVIFKLNDRVMYTAAENPYFKALFGVTGVVELVDTDSMLGEILTVELDTPAQFNGNIVRKIRDSITNWLHVITPKLEENKYPHTCIQCGKPCYNGFNEVDCSNFACASKGNKNG